MKKIIAFLFAFAASTIVWAQEEVADTIEQTTWSDKTKTNIVAAFVIIIIIIVLRTFRNKPTV